MTFQKTRLRNLILIVTVISVIVIFIGFIDASCGVQHMLILNKITSYEKSLDPEFCEVIVEKIDLFNDKCKPAIEILDCG